MINSINSVSNLGLYSRVNFKSEEKPVTNPNVATQNLVVADFSNYAVADMNLSKKFDVPVLKPTIETTDLSKVDGEKIYDSKGELYYIVKTESDKKTIYYPSDDNKKIDFLAVFDKNNKMIWEESYLEDDWFSVSMIDAKTGKELAKTWYEEGKPVEAMKNIFKPNGSLINVSYDIKGKTYSCEEVNRKGNVTKYYRFTPDLKYVTIEESKYAKDTVYEKTVDMYKGGIINIRESKSSTVPNLMAVEVLQDKDLKPEKINDISKVRLNFDMFENFEKIEKTYFSNGALETVKKEDNGKIVEFGFRPDGNIRYITLEDETCYSLNNGTLKLEKTLPDGTKKEVYKYMDNTQEVLLKKDNKLKRADFSEDGKIKHYVEYTFDENGQEIESESLWFSKGGMLDSTYYRFQDVHF